MLAGLSSSTPANPQDPSAITRIPMPSSSTSSTDATTPFLTVSRCTVLLMIRQSAYDAPAAEAASNARSLRSRTRAEYTAGVLPVHGQPTQLPALQLHAAVSKSG